MIGEGQIFWQFLSEGSTRRPETLAIVTGEPSMSSYLSYIFLSHSCTNVYLFFSNICLLYIFFFFFCSPFFFFVSLHDFVLSPKIAPMPQTTWTTHWFFFFHTFFFVPNTLYVESNQTLSYWQKCVPMHLKLYIHDHITMYIIYKYHCSVYIIYIYIYLYISIYLYPHSAETRSESDFADWFPIERAVEPEASIEIHI